MIVQTSRRGFLRSTGIGLAAAGLGIPGTALAHETPRRLRIDSRTIEVNGRAASVRGIFDDDSDRPYRFAVDQPFRVLVDNRIDEPTLLHWHGLTPPWMQDGVPDLPHPPIGPGNAHEFLFALRQTGSFWMHSHVGLQQQRLLAAPLIIENPADVRQDRQDVIVMLQDFSFREPGEILADLGLSTASDGHAMMPSSDQGDHEMAGMGGTPAMVEMAPHVNDFDQDAYLANERTLDDPDVIAVERGGRVRLRIINAAASTNFHIDTGVLDAKLVAVDGTDIVPIPLRRAPLAMGQRIDLDVDVPPTGGAFPVLALREGAGERTGLILVTAGATVQKIPAVAEAATAPLDLVLEAQLSAAVPLPARQADRRLAVSLTGSHNPYQWAVAVTDPVQSRPVEIAQGERIELIMTNTSPMLHPMHLHGHAFQVVDVGNGRFAGAVRDTIQVPPGGRVTVAFDADNPGHWAFHCHHLYHLAAGMMATLGYRGSV